MAKKKMNRPDNSPEAVKETQANHEYYTWFDVFECEAQKVAYVEPLTNETKVVTIAFSIGKRLKGVFIEKELAYGNGEEKGFNHYAIEQDRKLGGAPPEIYLEKDKYKNGTTITWEDMVKLMRIPRNVPNNVNMKRYRELTQAEFEEKQEQASE